jgi:hypothetical protein
LTHEHYRQVGPQRLDPVLDHLVCHAVGECERLRRWEGYRHICLSGAHEVGFHEGEGARYGQFLEFGMGVEALGVEGDNEVPYRLSTRTSSPVSAVVQETSSVKNGPKSAPPRSASKQPFVVCCVASSDTVPLYECWPARLASAPPILLPTAAEVES